MRWGDEGASESGKLADSTRRSRELCLSVDELVSADAHLEGDKRDSKVLTAEISRISVKSEDVVEDSREGGGALEVGSLL